MSDRKMTTQHAAEIARATHWEGDPRVNLTTAISACRVLERHAGQLGRELAAAEMAGDALEIQLREANTTIATYEAALRSVIAGNWCITELQELIGDV